MNEPPKSSSPDRRETPVSRREFLIRAGATGALIAGSVLAAKALWQKDHFVPGFEAEKGISLGNYKIEPSKVFPEMAIAHGTTHAAVMRAAISALGGMDRFIKKGDIVLIKPNVAFDRSAALGATPIRMPCGPFLSSFWTPAHQRC
jgi:hypothetical protein